MRRLLHPFVLVVSAILLTGYAYIAARLTSTAPVRMALGAVTLSANGWLSGREASTASPGPLSREVGHRDFTE